MSAGIPGDLAPPLFRHRLLVVTGKGGVGKTVVAATLGVAAARLGRRVLLAEVEERQGFAPLFGTAPLGYEERQVYPGVSALHVVPGEALVEYLRLFYGLPTPGRVLLRARAVEFATEVAPGLRDILLIGKVKEAVGRRRDSRFEYDLVILDAPPAGRVVPFLSAPRAVAELVRGGAIHVQADGVARLLADGSTSAAVVVAVPEEMPVVEAEEVCRGLRERVGLATAAVILNRVGGVRSGARRAAVEKLADGGGKASPRVLADEAARWGWRLEEDEARRLEGAARIARERERRERAYRRRLARLGSPLYLLPRLAVARVGGREIELLAEELLREVREERRRVPSR